MAVAAPSYGSELVEMAFLTVVAGVVALPIVAGATYALKKTDNYSTASATAAKVVLGTAATYLVIRKLLPHH